MKKTVFRLFSLLCVSIFMLTLTSAALAVDPANIPPADEISDNPNESFVDIQIYGPQGITSITLINATCGISKLSSSSVSCTASELANQVVLSIGSTIRLQKYESGQWHNVTSASKTVVNSSSCSQSRTFNVVPGYYYRTYAFHIAENGSDSSSAYTMSKAILVE